MKYLTVCFLLGWIVWMAAGMSTIHTGGVLDGFGVEGKALPVSAANDVKTLLGSDGAQHAATMERMAALCWLLTAAPEQVCPPLPVGSTHLNGWRMEPDIDPEIFVEIEGADYGR